MRLWLNWIEHGASIPTVAGSNPARRTKHPKGLGHGGSPPSVITFNQGMEIIIMCNYKEENRRIGEAGSAILGAATNAISAPPKTLTIHKVANGYIIGDYDQQRVATTRDAVVKEVSVLLESW